MDLLDVSGLRTRSIFSTYGSNRIEKSIKIKDDSHSEDPSFILRRYGRLDFINHTSVISSKYY